jgi:Fe-S-cluster containining protein
MLREMDEVRFACTACGKCCTEPPEMTILEAVTLGDVFVPSIVYRLTSLPRDDNEAAYASLKPHPHFEGMEGRALVARLRESTAVRAAGALITEAGWDHYVSITARAWIYPSSAGWCAAIDSSHEKCTIHDRRPSTCRTVPIRYDVPEGLLVRAFRGVVDAGIASSDPFRCDVSKDAPVLIRGEKVVSEEYASARAEGEAAALAEKNLAGTMLRSPLLPPIKDVYAALRQSKLLSVSFPAAIAAAHDLKMLDDAAVEKFCNAQLVLLRREIAAAVARRRKDERDVTTRFRALETSYRMMLARLAEHSATSAL